MAVGLGVGGHVIVGVDHDIWMMHVGIEERQTRFVVTASDNVAYSVAAISKETTTKDGVFELAD